MFPQARYVRERIIPGRLVYWAISPTKRFVPSRSVPGRTVLPGAVSRAIRPSPIGLWANGPHPMSFVSVLILGMYIERKSISGEHSDELSYNTYLRDYQGVKWRPPLSNHCMLLPREVDSSSDSYYY